MERRLPVLPLPRTSFISVNLFPHHQGGLQDFLLMIGSSFVLASPSNPKHLWGKLVQCIDTCTITEQNHTRQILPGIEMNGFLYCGFGGCSSHTHHQSELVWLSLEKRTKPICVQPYPYKSPSPQNEPRVSRLQNHGQKSSSIKVRMF